MVFVGGAFGTWVDFLGVHLARGLIFLGAFGTWIDFCLGAFGTWIDFCLGCIWHLGGFC
jgi:hypothetical protein